MKKGLIMKRTLVLMALLALIVASFSVVGCGKKEVSVSITNKDALTATWVEGQPDRTIEVKLSPSDYTLENTNVIVESSNSDVVDTDGFTLKAVGGGTATITVKAGNSTDSVEISVIPSLKGVTITNKAALEESWLIGSADRTMEIAFKPDYYSMENAKATIVSDNTAVVTVSGTTLKAKAIGTAKVTVTAGSYKDEVTINVRPAIESVTITNKEALEAEWAVGTERTIEATFAPDEYTALNTKPIVTAQPASAIEVVDGWKIMAKETGTVTVTITAQGKSDTFTVTIVHEAPVINVNAPGLSTNEAGELEMSGMEGANLTMPTVTAATTDGKDVSATLKVEYSNEAKLHVSGILMKPEVGSYTITYTATNPNDETKVATKTVNVHIYRKIIEWSDNTWQVLEERVPNAEQKITTTVSGYQTVQFNMAPSKYYYAEATFHLNRGDIGIANFVPENNHSRWLMATVQTAGDRNYKFTDFDTSKFANAWNHNENSENGLMMFYQYRLTEYGNLVDNGLVDEEGRKIHKVAMVRLGDTFYSFWNDQYVSMATLDYYAEFATVPGLFTLSLSNDAYATGIDYFSGEEAAKAKLDELTHNGKDIIRNYVPATDEWGFGDSKNVDNRNFTTNETTAERGINFDFTKKDAHFNGSCVSPFTYFDGDFTFSWEHKATSVSGGTRRMILEMRSRLWYSDTRVGGIQFGAEYNEDATLNRYLLGASALEEAYKWHEPGAGVDGSKGTKFTISRKLFEDYAEITLTAQSIANPAQRFTRVVTLGKTADKSTDGKTAFPAWNDPVVLQWHNTGVAGEYSNITWTARAAERVETVTIDNKDALTAAWREGGEDRTVSATLAPAGYTFANTKHTVTSSNPEVIAVSGNTLKAVGGGKATITVSVGFVSDSVEINVTPALQEVIIANKADIISWREDEEATRTLVLEFSPADIYNFENSEVSIVSENPEIVSVNGTTLTRVAQGDAKIIISARDGVRAEVTISVLPPKVQTVTVTNKEALEAEWENSTIRTIEATFDPSGYTTANTMPNITFGTEGIAEVVEGWVIKATALGTTTVTVEVQGKTDTFTITVVNGVPVLSISGEGITETEEGATMAVMEGKTITLPNVVATADGEDVTALIEVDYSDEEKLHIADGKATPAAGTYTITYTVANPGNTAKTTSKVVTLTVYRKIFGWTDNTWEVLNGEVSNAEQVITTNKNGFQMAEFKMAASDYYYAEATSETRDIR